MTWQDWLGNLSYVLLTASYLVTNMLALWLLAMAALSFEVVYFWFGSSTPLWVGIVWTAVFILVNAWQVMTLLRQRRRVSLDQQQRNLRQWLTPNLDEAEFLDLFDISLPVVFKPGQPLCRQGVPLTSLIVVVSGSVSVSIDGRRVRLLKAGSLVGEVSFLIDDVATATARAESEVTARVLPKASLRELCARSETIRRAVHESVTHALASRMASPLAA